MKSRLIFLLALSSFLFFSCADDLTDVGVSIQPSSDEILVKADAFHVVSENVFVESIYTLQDSFLLGNFYNEKFGSTQADIFAQLAPPVGYTFPKESISDSAFLYLYYRTWFGDSNSPIEVSIYEMNKKTFDYSTHYPSNLDPSEYSDETKLLSKSVFTIANNPIISGNRFVKFNLPKAFVESLHDSSKFVSDATFLDFFGGLYIKTKFGSSTLLNINKINLQYYYHHVITKNQNDTSIVTSIPFPANEWVRQVNRYVHNDRTEMVKEQDSVNYIASPANIETRVKIPLREMKTKMDSQLGTKKLIMNSAVLKLDVVDIDYASLAVPTTSYLLLIKESAMDRFFKNNELPNDTCAILSELKRSADKTSYYYSFNAAKMIATEFEKNAVLAENLNMRIVPVRVKFDSNNSVREVKHQFLMSGVTIKSGKNTNSPMRITTIYSGF